MRWYQLFSVLVVCVLLFTFTPFSSSATKSKQPKLDKVSLIIEVDGDPQVRADDIKAHFPFVTVVHVYKKLFNGIAIKGDQADLRHMQSLPFIKAVHPVVRYQAVSHPVVMDDKSAVIPSDLNNTTYTGKGVKVGIIDTGIDYHHPDLERNYVGGYDLVDLDDDPMETQPEQGTPTIHGTHVAGIIAADGKVKGVAPDANIYSYRALGPGGMGSSIQVLAALEEAVNDGMDIVNLSLGNTVNGPDYPTSVAVNKAVDLGVAVVIANGNSGPDDWTVGSPATASKALSVGALSLPYQVPYLQTVSQRLTINLQPMAGAPKWALKHTYQLVDGETSLENVKGKIALLKRGKIPFYDKAKLAEEAGALAVLIYNNEKGALQGSVQHDDPVTIPVAGISQKAGEKLLHAAGKQSIYLKMKYRTTREKVAAFSSRGPVTVNWHIKPDILAPGVHILSTIPGGKYEQLQGTSMAAPHIAGTLALLKEAHPDWTVPELEGALKTTAQPVMDENGQLFAPIIQGMGEVNPKKAIQTNTIIDHPLLSFGKINQYKGQHTITLSIENTSDIARQYYFSIPKVQKGVHFNLPQTFTIPAHQKKNIKVRLDLVTQQLDSGLYQGYIALHQKGTTIQLPYLFVNKTADFPKVMGLDFSLEPFSTTTYNYKIYLSVDAKSVHVNLYDIDTLVYARPLLSIKNVKQGINKGKLSKKDVGSPGKYLAEVTIQQENGTYTGYETIIQIE